MRRQWDELKLKLLLLILLLLLLLVVVVFKKHNNEVENALLNIEKGECDHVEEGSLAPQQTQPPQPQAPQLHIQQLWQCCCMI